MMIVMKPTATEEQVQAVIARIESCGARAHPSRGEEVTVIGAIGDREHVARLGLEGAPGVEQVVPILKPYKLSSRQLKGNERTVIEIEGRRIGGEHFSLIAGPCTVESRDQTLTAARLVAAGGASLFRGGAYKPRTSPYSFQGLADEGLRLLAEALTALEESRRGDLLAEAYRLQGELLLRQAVPDAAQAEASFQQSLAIAHRQQAKSWELRAAMSLSRLWQHQSKCKEAYDLLAPIYGWFTEGFDTADLQEAKVLLDELA